MPIVKPGKRPFAPWLSGHRAMKGSLGRRDGAADLVLTPLIDMFVILVVFLIMNFSSTGELPIAAGITLPKASVLKPREEAVPIDISPDSVSVQGHRVGSTAEILSDPELPIPALSEKLQDLRKIAETLNPGQPFSGDLIINSHKDVSFRLIRKVMYAAADAGYTNVNFAVLQSTEDGEDSGAAPPP